MRKNKIGSCKICPPGSPQTSIISGMCQKHYWESRNKVSKKRSLQRNPEQVEESKALGQYYEHHNANSNWICENCNDRLFIFSPQEASSCQAHILPKELFPSVAAVLDNHMLLGGLFQGCTCHKQYDSSWSKAESMPVFPLAVERFMKFKHLISPDEYKKLPSIFYQLIDK